MTSYIRRSFPAKRLEILEMEERELLHEIHSGYETEKLHRAAEKVRKAQLAVLKGKKHHATDNGLLNPERYQKIDSEMTEWASKTVDAIIEMYRQAGGLSQS